MVKQKYDWIVVGGGISGISVAEILTRQGKSVLLLEKNKQVASETSKVFHEWVHSGALYSLVPDRLTTMRYLLGATDDLLDYYKDFNGMNLFPSEKGIKIRGSNGWFNDNFIEYRYKIRKFNPIWMSMVSRSVNIVDLVNQHDWLRRRAGSEYGSSKIKLSHSFNKIKKLLLSRENFFTIKSPDFTMNSRLLVSDLLSNAVYNGLDIETLYAVEDINDENESVSVRTNKRSYSACQVVICSPDVIAEQFNIPIKTGYAPMAIVESVPDKERSFVELDYYTKRCINLLTKGNGIGQVGGITLDREDQIRPYLNYILKQHKDRNPEIKFIDDYVGIKKELLQSKEKRNYLYHINKHNKNIWSVVLGKFTLAFSMAPEFYRRVYMENPKKMFEPGGSKLKRDLISKTSWQEILEKKGINYGCN